MPAEPQLTQVEKDKLTINPDFDFREIARRAPGELTPNEIAMFKWSGVYQQQQSGFFMIRVVTPGGLMTARQLRRAAELAARHAQDQLCITTRQTLQFHWVRQTEIWRVLEGMAEVGITTRNGCGDVTRNVVSCSMQGVCPHEVGPHVRELILTVATDPEIRDRQRNLPRKHKISIAGCDRACAQSLINCQSWVPVQRQTPAGLEYGWQFLAGGGLGARPYLARRIFEWVPHALALAVIQAAVEVYRVRGDRRHRAFARLKVVVDTLGPQAFGKMVLEELARRGVAGLEAIRLAEDPVPQIAPAFLNGQARVAQRQAGLETVRVRIPRGELSSVQALQLAALAETFGTGEVMFTNRQNVELVNINSSRAGELSGRLQEAGFATEGHERLPDVVACVGTTVCRLAVSDTPAAAARIQEELARDAALSSAVGPLRINLTGCPNNCAHAWIADIGLRGKRLHDATGTSVEGFDLFVGGALDGCGAIARPVAEVPASQVVAAIRRILNCYLAERRDAGETFADFVRRAGTEGLVQELCDRQSSASVVGKESC